jgi:PAS domain S-box-containing protein
MPHPAERLIAASRRQYLAAPLCVLVVALTFTLILALHFHRQVTATAELRFDKLNTYAVTEVARRINQVLYGLRGTRGLYITGQHISLNEFRQYVQSRDLPMEFPGALGFGFIEVVPRDQLPAYLAAQRADGAPDFAITTAADAAELHPDLQIIKYLEPLTLNRPEWGLDAGSDPIRRQAIQTAIDTGQPAISRPVPLKQDPKGRTGLLYCLAVYRPGASPSTPEERRAALQGVLFAPILLEQALLGIEMGVNAHLNIQIFDGNTPNHHHLIFELNPAGPATAATAAPSFRQNTTITVGGRPWTFATSTNATFDAAVDYSATWIITIGGAAISLLSAFATYFLGTSRDRALALAQSMTADLARLAMVAQHTTNAVIITDRHQRITWANDGFTRITGYELSEVLGQIPGRLLQSPNTSPEAIDKIRIAIATNTGCRTEILNRAKDGHEYYLDLEIQPLHDQAGQLTGFIAIESDITDAVHQRQALAEQVAKLEEAESLANLGHWSWDTSTGTVEWSKQIFTIHRRDPAHGVPDYAGVLAHFSPLSAVILDTAIQTALDTGDSYHVILRTSDADERYLETAGRVRRDETGHITALYGTVRDVTTQVLTDRQLNEALAAAEAATQAKSDFLANMSHEIRTPMTAILGYTELLGQDGDRDAAPTRRLDYIDTIRRNGDHLLTIINDILDLSKIEAGKMTVERIPTSPSQIFHDVLSLMQVKAKEKNITLTLDCATDIPSTIQTDQVRFRQILVNLVSNAVKFTDTGGVTITASLLPDAMLQVSVTDTGIGMTDQQISRLFGAFQQADASTTRKFGGTGLGLRISKMLAQLLGGDIVVTSEPGKGSTFTATVHTGDTSAIPMIPGATAMLAVQTPEPLPTVPSPSTGLLAGMRILLAEDGVDNQRLISFHLKKAGAQVTIADNGRIALNHLTTPSGTGLELLPHSPFDLLITDMQMPEMDGYTLATTLRRMGSKLPILALTAHAMSGDAQRCLDAGCDAYSSKPIDRTQLIKLCAEQVRRTSTTAAA